LSTVIEAVLGGVARVAGAVLFGPFKEPCLQGVGRE